MERNDDFWSGMPRTVRFRVLLGLVYVSGSVAVLSTSPILGIVLLVAPILWTVFVIWIGSEDGISFGPHSRMSETSSGYLLRYLWRAPRLSQILLSVAFCSAVVGGLGWISTEKMRAAAQEPTLTERVTTAAENASEATRETAGGWFSNAKSWFSRDGEEP